MYKISKKYVPLVKLADKIGNTLYGHKKKRSFPKVIRKILVIRLDHIGDMLLTTPVFVSLKKKYPKAQLHVLGRSETQPILKNNKHVDRFIALNTPWFARGNKDSNKKIKEITKQLKQEKYDLVLELKGDPRNITLAHQIGGYIVGYDIRGAGFLLNKVVHWKEGLHISDQYLNVLQKIGCAPIKKLELNPDKPTPKLKKILSKIKKNNVMISLGVGAPEREWPVSHFTELVTQLQKAHKQVVLIDIDTSRSIPILEKTGKKNIIDTTGKLTLQEVITLLTKAKVVVSPESMAMHVAAALNVPIVDVHSSVTDPKEWGPYTKKKIVLNKFIDKFASLEDAQKGIATITSEKVFGAIKRLEKAK